MIGASESSERDEPSSPSGLTTEQQAEIASERRSQVGSGERAEKVRTYNFPQGRVSDHRINLTLYKLDRMLSGEAVDEVVAALVAHDQAEHLADTEG